MAEWLFSFLLEDIICQKVPRKMSDTLGQLFGCAPSSHLNSSTKCFLNLMSSFIKKRISDYSFPHLFFLAET